RVCGLPSVQPRTLRTLAHLAPVESCVTIRIERWLAATRPMATDSSRRPRLWRTRVPSTYTSTATIRTPRRGCSRKRSERVAVHVACGDAEPAANRHDAYT